MDKPLLVGELEPLGRSADMASACCLMLPFIRTGMTEEYADNPKVTTMLRTMSSPLLFAPLAAFALSATASAQQPTLPVFADGQAQVVEGFSDPDSWVQHDLWVETDFDSDGDGKLDRVHGELRRPERE